MDSREWVAWLPTVNASLNGLATVLLAVGYAQVRRGRVRAHRRTMLLAFAVSVLFLASYLVYHGHAGSKPFTGSGAVRPVYYGILLTHIVLAAAVPFLAVVTIYRGLTGQWARHRRIARITWPIWMYVSITGVLIYLMLYHWSGT